MTTHQNYAEGIALMAWAESNKRFFAIDVPDLDAAISAVGQMPLPPYIAGRRGVDAADRADYQTIYAAHDGAVAHLPPSVFAHQPVHKAATQLAAAFDAIRRGFSGDGDEIGFGPRLVAAGAAALAGFRPARAQGDAPLPDPQRGEAPIPPDEARYALRRQGGGDIGEGEMEAEIEIQRPSRVL